MFSNAIILLTIVSVALLIIKDADVNNLVPLYAIGVFTAFSMAGFGMARYHSRHRTPGWRRRMIINFSAGVMTAIVVAIFAVVKFTEGAWVVVVLFAVLVPALIRMNREYSAESEVLETISENQPPPPPHYSRRTVFVFVDNFDLATVAALRYARSMRPTSIRAVHFVIDSVRADKLRQKWTRADRGVPLDFIDVSDRRLTRAAAELVEREASDPGTLVTVVLPRRSYSALLGRLLHDRTADKIAAVVNRIPRSTATIIPYDVGSRVRVLQERHAEKVAGRPGRRRPARQVRGGAGGGQARRHAGRSQAADGPGSTAVGVGGEGPWPAQEEGAGRRPTASARQAGDTPSAAPGVTPIGSLTKPGRTVVEGRIRVVEIRPVERNSVLACEISDGTGALTALFYGRSHIPGIVCGARVRFKGSAGIKDGHPVMINPAYELIFPAV